MSFVWKMAWRDSRRSRGRLVLFSLSVVLGIAALVAIGSFSANLRQAIEDQAKSLLGADLAVESRQPLPEPVDTFLRSLTPDRAEEISFSSMAVFPKSGGQTRLISLRAVAGGFPFYGDFLTEPTVAKNQLHDAAAGDIAVIDENLLAQFGAKPGDPVKLGQKTFTIAGAVKKIPGDSAAITLLSPRVFVPLASLSGTGLVGPGSLVRYKTYLKLDSTRDVAGLVEQMRDRFSTVRLNFDTVERRKKELGRSLQNVYAFLNLVGFVALFLGAIGVASAIHVYVRQKIATVAVLRCLGASARQGFAVYLIQGVALGLFGAVFGAAIGVAVQVILPSLVKDFLPFHVDFFVSWAAVARGMGAGLVVCFLFTLLPLLAIRRVSPLLALRSALAESVGGRDLLRGLIYIFIAVAVTGFSVWQTQRWSFGLGFTGMLAVCFGLLAGLARGVAWAARRFVPKDLPYVWRQGVANLHRPNNRTVLLLVSLGLGTFLLLTLTLARQTLLNQISGIGRGDRPNLMFFDIQDDQLQPLLGVLAREGAPARAQAPIVAMRIRSINGRSVDELLKDEHTRLPAWTLRREYRSTYRGELVHTEKIVAGAFTGRVAAETEVIPISVEEGLAKDMQLNLGDSIEWDVQGVPMKTKITSVRAVDWQRLEPNFFVVFPEGVLETAPKFFVTAVKVGSPVDSARVQQAVVRDFPNVSAIDLNAILQALDAIFSKVEFVVRFMAFFTVGTGAVVLVGAVLAGRFQRIRETVLLRTLGATRRQLVMIQLVEYAALGFLAALTGGLLALVANALLAKFVFEVPITAPLAEFVLTVSAAAVLTLVTGFFTNRGIASHPPLEVLRQET
jgi:putative ABC transport system permease protein